MNTTLVAQLAGRRVLVLGDVCLDEYVLGQPVRLSREAAIPVLEFQRRDFIIGAAANPARNIVALGSTAVLTTAIGVDDEGRRLLTMLDAAGINPAGVVVAAERMTTIKTRVLANLGLRMAQQVARIDRVERRPLDPADEQRLIAAIADLAPHCDAVLCSDYLGGLLTPAVVAAAHDSCRRHGRLITVDAQGNADQYRDVDLFRCNAAEAEAVLGRALEREEEYEAGLRQLQQHLAARRVIVTRGAGGLSLVDTDGSYLRMPAHNPSEVFDTTGAGDTFIAVATLALCAGLDAAIAAGLASAAAGVVVRRLGNAVVTPAELAAVLAERSH